MNYEHMSPSEAFGRLAELSQRVLLSTTQHGKPLTPVEHVELLAAGAIVARFARHPAHVHDAVKAGAAWLDIAKALGVSEDQAREDYRQWAHGQHGLHGRPLSDGTRLGLDDSEYAKALARSEAS
jgi:hypothetical protein